MKFRAFIFLLLASLFSLICSFNVWAKHSSLHHSKNLETSQRESLNHPLRLSNKGDLSTNYDNIKRRRFYMKGDGNCFFWAIGLTRKQAVNIWLKYANNPIIRKMGCEDIYQHAFVERKSDFALTLQNDPSYIKLISDSNNYFRKLEQSYLANNVPLPPELDPLALEREGEYLDNRKILYCQGEAIYRNYIKHYLSRDGQWMSMFLGPCFASILAFDQKKNLVVFHYDNNDHPKKLITAMHYTHPQTTKEAWEILHHINHFNRVVPINNLIGLKQGLIDESTHLGLSYIDTEKKKIGLKSSRRLPLQAFSKTSAIRRKTFIDKKTSPVTGKLSTPKGKATKKTGTSKKIAPRKLSLKREKAKKNHLRKKRVPQKAKVEKLKAIKHLARKKKKLPNSKTQMTKQSIRKVNLKKRMRATKS